MKRTIPMGAITATAALLLAGFVSAQKPSRYDVSKEKTFSGTVEAVLEIPGGRQGSGLHVTLVVEAKKWDVHLGPSTFVKGLGLELAKGDAIQVTGAADAQRGILLARELKKGDRSYRLRTEQGIPLWSGGRRK